MSPNQPAVPLQIAEEDGCVTVRFSAITTLSEANAEELSNELQAIVQGREKPQVVVDLANVCMLTSIILAKFIALNNRVRAAGGRLTLTNPNPIVTEVFKVTRLDTVLEVTPRPA